MRAPGLHAGVSLATVGAEGGGDLAAGDEFAEVSGDGAAGDAELAAEGGHVGRLAVFAKLAEHLMLAGKSLDVATVGGIVAGLLGTFDGLDHAHGLAHATFGERDLDGPFELGEVDGLGDDEAGGPGPLQGAELALDVERSGDDDDGDVGGGVLETREEFNPELPLRRGRGRAG